VTDDVVRPFHLERRGLVPDPDALYATLTLRNTQSLSGWRSRNQRCEPPQVLSNGSQNKLVLSTLWTTQSKPTELQDALQVREPHLDLLALSGQIRKHGLHPAHPLIADGSIALGKFFAQITRERARTRVVVHRIIAVGDYVWAHVNFLNLFNDDPEDTGIAGVDIYKMTPTARQSNIGTSCRSLAIRKTRHR